MSEYKGVTYLRKKLMTVRNRVNTRYEYYEMKNNHTSPEVAIPWKVANCYKSKLGWCTKAVDLLADRLVVKGFKNDRFGMQNIFDMNNADILYDSAILGALISACDFIYLFLQEDGNVGMQVIDGSNATGILDRTTNLLTEGYAVLKRDSEHKERVLLDAYFTSSETVYTDFEAEKTYSIPNYAGIPLLVPIICRPDSKREFGHSRIARDMMKIQDQAEDLQTRINVMSEIGSWPQKYILGLSETAGDIDNMKATISSMLRFDKDEDGDRPTVGQFNQLSLSDSLAYFEKMVAQFAGTANITTDDMGFVTANPSSADAKKTALESLRVIAGKCQRSFGTGFINAGYTAVCLRDKQLYKRSAVYETSVIWAPLVEPDAAMFSQIGDGVIKINQSIPGFFDKAALEAMTGIKGADNVNAGLFNIDEFSTE